MNENTRGSIYLADRTAHTKARLEEFYRKAARRAEFDKAQREELIAFLGPGKVRRFFQRIYKGAKARLVQFDQFLEMFWLGD